MDSRIEKIKEVFAVIQQDHHDLSAFIEDIVTKNAAITILEKEKSPRKSSDLCVQRKLSFTE